MEFTCLFDYSIDPRFREMLGRGPFDLSQLETVKGKLDILTGLDLIEMVFGGETTWPSWWVQGNLVTPSHQ